MENINVKLEFTPNPNTLKYSVNREILSRGTENFLNRAQATNHSPLAEQLFDINGIEAVMLGTNFITLTIDEDIDLEILNDQVINFITKFFESDEKAITSEPSPTKVIDLSSMNESDQEIVKKVQVILENEIRPAVAQDGGDILFHSYSKGTLYLSMIGSCSGCPSSTITLKEGIQTRLQQEIPEIQEVLSI